jgi:uncharacterized membrane protein YhhN
MTAPRNPWLATLPWQVLTLVLFAVAWFTDLPRHRLRGWWLVAALLVWLTGTTLWFWRDRRKHRASEPGSPPPGSR